MKQPGSLAVVHVSFTLKFSRIAQDGEVHVLASGLGCVQALKGAERPIGLVAGSSSVVRLE